MSTTTTSSPGPGGMLPPVRRPPLALLTRVELRKAVDTRAGRVLLAIILGIAVLILGFGAWNAEGGDTTYSEFLLVGRLGALLLLPIIGILAMTSEWTQRTVLTTFTLTPRRARVLTAKLLAAVLLSTVLMLLVAALAAVAAVAAGLRTGTGVRWDDTATTLLGTIVSSALMVLMGAAIGALVMNTAAAIVVYYVVPNAVIVAGAVVLEDDVRWFNVQEAFTRLSDRDLLDHVWPTVTSVALWVLLPLVLGVWRSLRRNVS